MRMVWLIANCFLLIALFAGCRHARRSVVYSGCVVTKTWTDSAGNPRKDCICIDGKPVAVDAKRRAVIIRCAPKESPK